MHFVPAEKAFAIARSCSTKGCTVSVTEQTPAARRPFSSLLSHNKKLKRTNV